MKDRLVVVGASFKRLGFEKLGRCVLDTDDGAALAGLRDACGASELVYVATCNRVEAYLVLPPDAPALREQDGVRARVAAFYTENCAKGHAESQDFLVHEGRDALEHLFRVVSSLDSLVVGECEIGRQVRQAVDRAVAVGVVGPVLRRVFDQAQRSGRRVRTETAIGQTPVSVASLVVRIARDHFAAAPKRAVLVGVTDMTKKIAAALERDGTRLVFVNRTRSRAEELAARYSGEALSLDAFREVPPSDFDLLVSATRAPAPFIDERTLSARLMKPGVDPVLVCDLGVPANVAPSTASLPGVRLVKLTDLEARAKENQERLASEVEHATRIVAEDVARAHRELKMRALAEESVDGILTARLAHLAGGDREIVRRFAVQLAERMARQPLELTG